MSSSIPLLGAKLDIPPGRPTLIARPRLTMRLTAGWTRPLTLICTPAGFGKTTLLTQWIADELPATLSPSALPGQSGPHAWPGSPWMPMTTILCTSLPTWLLPLRRSIDPELCATTSAILNAAELPALPTLATYLLHDLSALDQPLILALDDYHVITAAPVHDALGFMLAHLPPAMHLILLSHEAHPCRWPHVRNQLLELREEDLRFSLEEVSAFLTRTMGLELSAAAQASLADRTKRWMRPRRCKSPDFPCRIGAMSRPSSPLFGATITMSWIT